MSTFKQGDKVKVLDRRSANEKKRVVIGQGGGKPGYLFKRGEESCELTYGEVLKISTSTTATFVNRDHSIPLINSKFANSIKDILELVEAPDSD